MDHGELNATKTGITGTPSREEDWSLDPLGNWSEYLQKTSGTTDLNQSRSVNRVNEIIDISETTGPSWVTPGYDRNGNMTTIPKPADPAESFTATYDAWNRLVKIAAGSDTVAEYAYDGAKRRTVAKTYSGGVLDETRHFYYTEPSKWQVIEERPNSSTAPDRQFIWGLRYIDDILLRDRDTDADGTLDERLYALQDANWNVTAIANEGGVAEERYAYSPYGATSVLEGDFGHLSGSGFDWESGFAGYITEFGVWLYLTRNRWFEPRLGCWLGRDPLSLNEDATTLYEYARSRPLTNIDPFGLYDWEVGRDNSTFCRAEERTCISRAMRHIRNIIQGQINGRASCFSRAPAGRHRLLCQACRDQLDQCLIDTMDSHIKIDCRTRGQDICGPTDLAKSKGNCTLYKRREPWSNKTRGEVNCSACSENDLQGQRLVLCRGPVSNDLPLASLPPQNPYSCRSESLVRRIVHELLHNCVGPGETVRNPIYGREGVQTLTRDFFSNCPLALNVP